MGMTEKDSLINALTISIAEDYQINLKTLKAKISEVMQNYHVTISDECYAGNDLSTEYLLQKFSDGKSAVGMKIKTIEQYKIAVSKLEQFCKKRLSDIEPEDITNFMRDYGKIVSDVTLRAKYQLISSVYNYLFSHKYIAYNPIMYVDAPKQTIVYKKPITILDLEKIKNACEKLPAKESLRDMAMIYFFTSTGVRVSELCNVKIKDVDFDKKVCVVIGKGKKQRPVVLDDKAIYRMKLYLESKTDISPESPLFSHIRGEEKQMTKDGVIRTINKIRDIAGVENLTCHTFRRFYATELRRRNVNVQMIATSLGHANLNQINRYSLYNSTEMLDTIRASM